MTDIISGEGDKEGWKKGIEGIKGIKGIGGSKGSKGSGDQRDLKNYGNRVLPLALDHLISSLNRLDE